MLKKYKMSFIVIIGLGLGISGYAWKSNVKPEVINSYKTTMVSLGSVTETVVATGVIRPMVGAEINVGSRISGTVVSLPVQIGDEVKIGQLLAELDATLLQATVDQREADVELAIPSMELARSMLKRSQKLAGRGLSSAVELDKAQRDLAVEEAQLKVSEARLRSAKTLLGYTKITSPIQGVVAEVSTRKGETIAADFSAPTFVTILNLSRLEVLAYVDETDIGRIQVGQQASFTVDTYPDQEFTSIVSAIQPRAEIQGSVVNYVVRLDFTADDDFILRPEMTAHVRLMVSTRDDILKAPRSAVINQAGRQYVMVQRQGQWVQQNIRTGWRSESVVEILSGVDAGAVLAINPS